MSFLFILQCTPKLKRNLTPKETPSEPRSASSWSSSSSTNSETSTTSTAIVRWRLIRSSGEKSHSLSTMGTLTKATFTSWIRRSSKWSKINAQVSSKVKGVLDNRKDQIQLCHSSHQDLGLEQLTWISRINLKSQSQFLNDQLDLKFFQSSVGLTLHRSQV